MYKNHYHKVKFIYIAINMINILLKTYKERNNHMTMNSENKESKNNRTTARFEKVSFKQFAKDWIKFFPEDEDNNE